MVVDAVLFHLIGIHDAPGLLAVCVASGLILDAVESVGIQVCRDLLFQCLGLLLDCRLLRAQSDVLVKQGQYLILCGYLLIQNRDNGIVAVTVRIRNGCSSILDIGCIPIPSIFQRDIELGIESDLHNADVILPRLENRGVSLFLGCEDSDHEVDVRVSEEVRVQRCLQPVMLRGDAVLPVPHLGMGRRLAFHDSDALSCILDASSDSVDMPSEHRVIEV